MNTSLKELQAEPEDMPFVLRELEVFNWGGFHGLHTVRFDEAGAAIVGLTGSGKTTLVDALMTLLAEHPRYNLASTGGHDSDRSLAEYVRGELGSDTGEARHLLRPSPTLSGISALFASNTTRLRLSAVLWYSNADEMTKAWITDHDGERTLEHWLTLQRDGGMKALRRVQNDVPGIQVYPNNKREFAAAVRRFFEVGDNAFTLLSRAVGMKQINSMDQLFRQLVLDDNSQFNRAEEVAQGFDTLTQIHEELVTARRQIESLEPIASRWTEYRQREDAKRLHEQLLKMLTVWFALREHAQLTSKIAQKQSELGEARLQWTAADTALRRLREKVQILRDAFMSAGGLNIQHLQEHIESQQSILSIKGRAATDYIAAAKHLGLDSELSARALLENQSHLPKLLAQEERSLADLREAETGARLDHFARKRTLQETHAELEEVKLSQSNIPRPYQAFRTALARHLDVEDSEVPFVAELVQVREEHSRWRGAIERAIGSNRLRILVARSHMPAAVQWVNDRNTGLHVRLLEVDPEIRAVDFLHDGFTRKLEFKRHAFREALKALLKRIDRHCVAASEQLLTTPYAMTVEGTMSAERGYVDKQDDHPLERGWLTGFDNRDRLRELSQAIDLLIEQCDQLKAAEDEASGRLKDCGRRLELLRRLQEIKFEEIDEPGALQKIEQLRVQLEALVAPGSKAHLAKEQFEAVQRDVPAIETAERTAHDSITRIETEIRNSEKRRSEAFEDIGPGLTDTQMSLAAEHFPTIDSDSNIAAMRRGTELRHRDEVSRLTNVLADAREELTALMAEAKHVDTGALSEVHVQIADVPAYLERLRVLQEEALPAKQKDFLTYLNDSSDKDVTELLSEIESEVSRIQERIEDLNGTLRRVDFLAGVYLRLVPRPVLHQQLRTFQQAQRNIRAAALADDQGESHFASLREMVMLLREASAKRKSTSEADRALLDPRYRMSFAVALIDRASGDVLQERTGSQGDSGGEKENMASFVLISSLGYALCPPAREKPLFGTVVLDEAFSRSSTGIGNAVMKAMREFGLCPVLVTPNKEMRLLRRHTRSAVIVQRIGNRSVARDITWEMLDSMRSERS